MSYSTISEQAMLAKVAEMLKDGGGGGGGGVSGGADWNNPEWTSGEFTLSQQNAATGLFGKMRIDVSGGFMWVHGEVNTQGGLTQYATYQGYHNLEALPPYKVPGLSTANGSMYNIKNALFMVATRSNSDLSGIDDVRLDFTEATGTAQFIIRLDHINEDAFKSGTVPNFYVNILIPVIPLSI